MVIIKQRTGGSRTDRYWDFTEAENPGSGYSFEVDSQGQPNLTENSQPNWDLCWAGVEDGTIINEGIRESTHTWNEPAVGRCPCGAEVVLEGFTNTCDGCGTDYNSAGQALAPREQWGEETGEHLADILRIA